MESVIIARSCYVDVPQPVTFNHVMVLLQLGLDRAKKGVMCVQTWILHDIGEI
jgi:hypothetical protein